MRYFIFTLSLFLSSCVALSQEDLKFLDVSEMLVDRPEFQLVDMRDGSNYDSRDHAGKAYLIEFYFRSCEFCRRNQVNFERMAALYEGNPNVAIIEIGVDCKASEYEWWIEAYEPKTPVLNGCDSEIADVLSISSFPTTIVFSPGKRQVMRGVGVWSASTFNRIKSYLDQAK